jgi:UDP-galactose transporter B1
MGVFVFGKQPGWAKYLCVLLVTLGITIFMSDEIHNSKGGAETSAFGILLLGLSLAMDGVTGPFQVTNMYSVTYINNVQDQLVHKYKPSSPSMMLYTNLWASIYLGAGTYLTVTHVHKIRIIGNWTWIARS